MNDNENSNDSKKLHVIARLDLSSLIDTGLENFAKKRGMTVDELLSQLEAAKQKKLLLKEQDEKKKDEEKKRKEEEEKTDFATFQEVADYLDSVLSYKDKGTFLEHGDRNDLDYFHLDFGIFIRNNFIYRNKSKRELARDCSRIAGCVVSDDLSDYEFDVTEGDYFGGKLMELYYQWLAMLPPFS